jgi:integrase
LRIQQFDRPEKIRPIIKDWRNKWAAKPRTADYAMQVLSRVLSYAADELNKIAGNPCEGIKQLYVVDRSDIIWTDADLERLKSASCPAEVAHAVDLAAHTGLRLGDLLRLSWSHVSENAIELTTSKSRHRKSAIIPLYNDLRAILARIPALQPLVSRGTEKGIRAMPAARKTKPPAGGGLTGLEEWTATLTLLRTCSSAAPSAK